MKILTRYVYEKIWRPTAESDALRIIEDQVGDADPKETWSYVKTEIARGKTITAGECRFKGEEV